MDRITEWEYLIKAKNHTHLRTLIRTLTNTSPRVDKSNVHVCCVAVWGFRDQITTTNTETERKRGKKLLTV